MKKLFLILSVFLLLMVCACKNRNEQRTRSFSEEHLKIAMTNGERVYRTHCMACHLTDGSGKIGLYPPLTDNETVSGDTEKLVTIILQGMSGAIVVKGVEYNQVMIPHNFLTNTEIANLLTYLRNSFGNHGAMIHKDEVEHIRNKLIGVN